MNQGKGWFSSHFAGQFVIVSQLTQLVLMANYIYYYIKAYVDVITFLNVSSVIEDAPMRLPTYSTSKSE